MLNVKQTSKKIELSLDHKREICNYYNANINEGIKIKQVEMIRKFNREFNVVISKSTSEDKNEPETVVTLISYKTLYDSLNNITNCVEKKLFK